jgi:hypothetical protein
MSAKGSNPDARAAHVPQAAPFDRTVAARRERAPKAHTEILPPGEPRRFGPDAGAEAGIAPAGHKPFGSWPDQAGAGGPQPAPNTPDSAVGNGPVTKAPNASRLASSCSHFLLDTLHCARPAPDHGGGLQDSVAASADRIAASFDAVPVQRDSPPVAA